MGPGFCVLCTKDSESIEHFLCPMNLHSVFGGKCLLLPIQPKDGLQTILRIVSSHRYLRTINAQNSMILLAGGLGSTRMMFHSKTCQKII